MSKTRTKRLGATSDKKLLGARASLLVTKGISTSSILATSNKKLLGVKGISTRSKDATRGSWPYY